MRFAIITAAVIIASATNPTWYLWWSQLPAYTGIGIALGALFIYDEVFKNG